MRDDMRANLQLALHAYYSDRVHNTVLHPGVGERAILLQGSRPGSALGVSLRLVDEIQELYRVHGPAPHPA